MRCTLKRFAQQWPGWSAQDGDFPLWYQTRPYLAASNHTPVISSGKCV